MHQRRLVLRKYVRTDPWWNHPHSTIAWERPEAGVSESSPWRKFLWRFRRWLERRKWSKPTLRRPGMELWDGAIAATWPWQILSEPVGGAAIRVVRCCKWIPIVSHSYGGDVPTDAGESSHPLGGSYRKQAHVVVGDLSWSQDLLPGFSFPWASKLRQ